MATALVIENDPSDDVRRLGGWLTDAGLELSTLRPYTGDPVPADLDGYAALVVLGGERRTPGDAGWLSALESLLRRAVRTAVPTLAIGLGGQLLATAHGGRVEPSPSGPEIGPALVARRDAADRDALFALVPFVPDVLQWHRDEITELPAGAVLLAASTRYPHQAFRMGQRAWGTQFHLECDTAMVADWARADHDVLAALGLNADELVAACDALMGEWEDTWQPFAWRFAALAQGQLPESLARRAAAGHIADLHHLAGADGANGPGRRLPLLGQ